MPLAPTALAWHAGDHRTDVRDQELCVLNTLPDGTRVHARVVSRLLGVRVSRDSREPVKVLSELIPGVPGAIKLLCLWL